MDKLCERTILWNSSGTLVEMAMQVQAVITRPFLWVYVAKSKHGAYVTETTSGCF